MKEGILKLKEKQQDCGGVGCNLARGVFSNGFVGYGSCGRSQTQSNVDLNTHTLFWNLNYWDLISTLAGEVDNPSEGTFLRPYRCGVVLLPPLHREDCGCGVAFLLCRIGDVCG